MSKKLILTPNAYKAGKVYAVKPINGTGDFDFVRNTGRTRVNVNGNIEELSNNIVALDYQNGCPEILLEPQRTNLNEYSEDFSDSYWTDVRAGVTPNTISSPTNNISNQNADTVSQIVGQTFTGGVEFSYLYSNVQYTVSCFAKKKEKSFINIGEFAQNGSNNRTFFNLENGTIGTISSGHTAKIEKLPNDWYRCSITFIASVGQAAIVYYLADSDNLNTVNPNGGGVYLWGAQLEEGDLTSYIPTDGSTVTRNKDILSKDLTNIIQPTYTAFLEIVGDEGRLKIEDNNTGIEVPLNGAGKIAIQVDSQIKIIFPNNGQPETELLYDKPDDLRNIDIVSKLAATRIGVIAIEDGIQDVSNWISGNVSSYFIETDWSAETNLQDEFNDDYDYFPAIDLSSGTNFNVAWLQNNLTSFPAIDLSNGTIFSFAWQSNNLASFPTNMFDTNTASDYFQAFKNNNLDQQSVDNILISVNTSAQANNITNGDLGIQGGTNATPSQAGKDAADALFANGWTVELNGYTPS